MEYRRLGASDLDVSVISLGSWLTYGVGVDRERSEVCVHHALDLGINLFDTANAYGRGAAETVLGETLKGVDRSSYVLATKLYFPMGPADRGLSAAQVRKQCDASLRRLQTDVIDLYQCHRYDKETPLEETMEALTELVRDGKVRWLGFSEWSAPQVQASIDLAAERGYERFVSSQPQYSMLFRKHEPEVFPLSAREGIGQIVWSPLAQGVLTGKYEPGAAPPPDSRAAHETMGETMDNWLEDDVLVAVQRLRPIADGLGLTMSQLALAWVLRQPVVSSAIVGATRPEQLDDNVGAVGVTLTDDVCAAIDEALAPVR